MAGPYTAIQTRSAITLAVLKEHLRIDGNARDTTLNIILQAVKGLADRYVKTNFLDTDGVTPLDIPPELELAVLTIAARWVAAPLAGQAGGSKLAGGMQLSDQDKALLQPWWRPAGL